MKCLEVRLGLWKWSGCVLAGGTPADFAAFAKKSIGAELDTDSGVLGRAYLEKGQPWLLWVESAADVATLAHEALHITAGILEARGLKFDESSEEAYTYTMESIIRAVVSAKRSHWKAV